MSTSPLISVLTPTWNRADYLPAVWKGLCAQTFRDFEWVVANDGSTDETVALIRELAAQSNFQITLIDASAHVGKPRMDNELLRHARGEFILWNDSDDHLVPIALERLVAEWKSIPEENASEYVGLTALCSDPKGVLQSRPPPYSGPFDTTWNELSERYEVEGDKLFFVRSEVVKGLQFVEVDYMVTESSFWYAVSDMKTRFLPEVLKIMDRNASNRISFSGKMEYCRGKAYGMAIAEGYPHGRRRPLRGRLWKAITFFRYCSHGDVPLRTSLGLWDGNLDPLVFRAMVLPGLLLAFKDVLQRKVRKTHIDFDRANAEAVITVTEYSAREATAA